jgi:hypothetical protein
LIGHHPAAAPDDALFANCFCWVKLVGSIPYYRSAPYECAVFDYNATVTLRIRHERHEIPDYAVVRNVRINMPDKEPPNLAFEAMWVKLQRMAPSPTITA